MTARWFAPAGLHTAAGELPIESRLPSLDGATGWLNTPPLTTADLRGKVVVVNFWTYTCINWLRQLPYVRAWAQRYSGDGLAVLGVHTPEFRFERDVDNVRRAVENRSIDYPVATDDEYRIWEAFDNRFWPALYVADTQGRIRYHHFGEGEYLRSEMVLRQLLVEAGADAGPGRGPERVAPRADGIEAPADWASLRTPENYTGYGRTEAFASPGGMRADRTHSYAAPERLGLNQWALSGAWTAAAEFSEAGSADAGIVYRFQARDVHAVMGPAQAGAAVRYRVLLDGQPPAEAHGGDVDADGDGSVTDPRLYQLIRQPGAVHERTVEITFTDPGARVYAFTFG